GIRDFHVTGVQTCAVPIWDVMPTLAEVANAPLESPVDGISFLPELLGQEQKKHDHLYWEFHEQGGKQAVRKGNWKAVLLRRFERSQERRVEKERAEE